MKSARIAALSALVVVAGCEGLKEAMTAHVDVVARAEGQELSVERLADLMGKSQVPLSKPVAEQIATVWVNYQLLGHAGARSDSLADDKLIDEVMWPVYAQSKTRKWLEMVRAGFTVDTSNAEDAYNSGRLLSARHILFAVSQEQAATGSDSVMRRAEAVRKQVTAANFAAMAKQYGSDGTKDVGGDLGVFPPNMMVPEFSQAVASLKPGEIGPLVRTQFGYHIIKRNTFEEAREQFRTQYAQMAQQVAESTFVANVQSAGKLDVKPNAAKVIKEVAADLDGHRGDRTAIASSTLGTFTAGDAAKWIAGWAQRDRLRDELQQAPDSLVPNFVKSLVLNELFLKQADSAGIALDTTEVASIRQAFKGLVRNSWAGLRVAPEMLADSGKTDAERMRVAAGRVDGYLGRLLQNQEGFIEVPPPLADALREKYDASIKPAGLQRALELAQRMRASADSSRAASQPKSAVPVPTDTSAGAAKR